MATSGSGKHDDSFFSPSGGAKEATAASGEFRTASSHVSNSSYTNSGDRPAKDSAHHQLSSREGGRRERHNNNDDPSSRSPPESPKLEAHRSSSRAHPQNTHHQTHHDHLTHGGREVRDGGVGESYQLHSGMSENLNSDELVSSNNERITQRHSNSHRLSSTSNCGGVGGTCNHQCSNQTQTMPSTASPNAGFRSTSDSTSTGGSNTNVFSPSPQIELPVGSNTIAGEDSDYSDFGQQQPSTSNSRSRQKSFSKTSSNCLKKSLSYNVTHAHSLVIFYFKDIYI